jgi:hypothetical protein
MRTFSNNHGVKLKSTHAHELVAAFFGYKSKAAMQADNLCSIENISQAHILVLTPSSFIEERRKCLEDLPSDLSDSHKLNEELSGFLVSQCKHSDIFFKSWKHLAEAFTTEYLQKNRRMILSVNFWPSEITSNIFNKPLDEFNPKIEATDNGTKLIVTNRYEGLYHSQSQSIEVAMAIELYRIAGHIGYAKAEISLIDASVQSFAQSGVL